MSPPSCFCISIAFTSKELVFVGSSVDRFGSKIIVVSIIFSLRKSCFCLSPPPPPPTPRNILPGQSRNQLHSPCEIPNEFPEKTCKSQQLPHFLDGCQHPHLQHRFDLPSSPLYSLLVNFSTEVLNLRLKERAFFQVESESVRS